MKLNEILLNTSSVLGDISMKVDGEENSFHDTNIRNLHYILVKLTENKEIVISDFHLKLTFYLYDNKTEVIEEADLKRAKAMVTQIKNKLTRIEAMKEAVE